MKHHSSFSKILKAFDRGIFSAAFQRLWKGLFVGSAGLFLLSIFLLGGGSFQSQENFSASVSLPFSLPDGLFGTPDATSVTNSENNNAVYLERILETIFNFLQMIVGIIGIVWLVWAGFSIVSAGTSEERIQEGRRMVMYTVLGLLAMYLVKPLLFNVFLGGQTISYLEGGINNPAVAADNFYVQVKGLLDWAKLFVAFIAMVFIIFSGAKMIFAMGDDVQIGESKKSLGWVVLGILVIAFNEFFINQVLYDIIFRNNKVEFTPDVEHASVFIVQAVFFIQYILTFAAIIAFTMFIIGGFMYVISFGNEERAETGKKIFIGAAIGMLVILVSFAITYSIISLNLFGQ